MQKEALEDKMLENGDIRGQHQNYNIRSKESTWRGDEL
jgi:hypothetical protein